MLANKKVYVGKFSKEIQEKAFKLRWKIASKTARIELYPFFYFNDQKEVFCGNNLQEFNNSFYQEVSPEWILALEEPKTKKTSKKN